MSVRTGPVRWSGPTVLVVWVCGRLLAAVGSLLLRAVCRPRITGAAVGAAGVGWLLLTRPVEVLAGVVVAAHACEVWAHAHPASWRRRGLLRALAWWRALFVYRRQWQAAMVVAELDRGGVLPRLGRVRCLDAVDVVQARGLLGQRFAEWEVAGPMLAHVFGASGVRVHRGDDRRLTLELVRARRGRAWNRDGRLDLEGAA